jgi:putative OPT family oligopeptide transporter
MVSRADAPGPLRILLFRPTGIGILIGAAVGSIVFAAPLIRSAVRSMHDSAKEKAAGGSGGDEMSIKLLYTGVAVGALALIALTWTSVEHISFGRALAMALLGVLWVWIAGVIVSECVGRTNWNPVSGMTLIAVTILLLVAGYGGGLEGTPRIVSSVFMGAAICIAISQASDMMLDLKSGYLVGASPRKQQIAQVCGTWLGPIIIMGLIFLLARAGGEEGGFGSEKLPAAQATALASVIEGIVGGDIPQYRYFAGAGLGLLVALSGLGGIGVLLGLGFYMPFYIVLTYTVGNLLRICADRFAGRHWVENTGIPLGAGFIVGEALVGVGNAVRIITGIGVDG